MIDYNAVQLRQLSIHQVGNRTKEDGIRLSVEPVVLDNQDTIAHLRQYFLSAFNNAVEVFQFSHASMLDLNEVFTYCGKIFNDVEDFHEQSMAIARHLYERSSHPKINNGELSVCLMDDVNFRGTDYRAIGIFKAESRDVFLQFNRRYDKFDVDHQDGIPVNKLEKGCLILELEQETGYQVLIIDSNRSGDAQYWKNEFLQVRPCADSYQFTRNVLTLTKDFVTQQVPEEFQTTRTDQIDLLNRSVEYFKTHETFNKQEFAQEVFHHEHMIESFRRFDNSITRDDNFQVEDNFQISTQAVKKQARIFKSVLKLDKNFHIYIHGNRDLIEHGVDERGRKFYKIYYDNES